MSKNKTMNHKKDNNKKDHNRKTSTGGIPVNTSYLRSPQKIVYPPDLSAIDKGLRSLDDYQDVYDRDMCPIINSSVIEIKRENRFINRFKARNPHLETLSTTEHKKGKYSLIETIYLTINKEMLYQKHLMKEGVTKKQEKNDELKREPIPLHSILQKTLTLYIKRVLILDRLLVALHQFDIRAPQLQLAKVMLQQNIEEPEFYLNSFFNTNSSYEEIQSNFTFLIKKVNNKYKDYKQSLYDAYGNVVINISRDNMLEINKLESMLNRYCSKSNSHDRDYFIYFYREYALNYNFNNFVWLTPAQRTQLEGYFNEIYILVRLILMYALAENNHLLVAVSKMEFVPITTIINQSLAEFLKSSTCSNTVYANLLKSFTKHTLDIVNYFYANCTDHMNLYLYPLIKSRLDPITNPPIQEQQSITSEVKTLVGESADGELILEDIDTPKV
jgi:hypothetical protein